MTSPIGWTDIAPLDADQAASTQRALAAYTRAAAFAQADERWDKFRVRSTVVPMRAGGVIVGWASLTQEEPERVWADNPFTLETIERWGLTTPIEVVHPTLSRSMYNVARVDGRGPRIDPLRPLLGRRPPTMTAQPYQAGPHVQLDPRVGRARLDGGWVRPGDSPVPSAFGLRSVHGRPR